MDSPTKRFQCINECNTFETVGIPTYCPHCGSKELHPYNKAVEMYERSEEHEKQWVNNEQ